MPENELSSAARFVDHRRTVAGLFGRQGAPKLFACVLVERDDRAALARSQADQFLSVNQWVPGEPPERCLDTQFLLKIVRPKNFAVARVEAKEVSFGPERIHFALAARDV